MAVNPLENKVVNFNYSTSTEGINSVSSSEAVNSVMNADNNIVSNTSSGIRVENTGEIDDETYKELIKDLQSKIDQKKQDLSDTKKNKGWLSSIGNSISEVFGGGDKSKQKEIEDLEAQLNSLKKNPEDISGVYKNIMGADLDKKAVSSLQESNAITKNLSTDQNKQIQDLLNKQCEELEAEFNDTKSQNGWISGTWNSFKNWAGVGESSNKTQTQIDNMKKELDDLKNHPENLAQAYKNITGRDLNNEELTKLANGELSLKDVSKASEAVTKYAAGQKMATDVFADIVTGIVAVGAIALAPFTGGASLLLAAGVGAAIKVGLKASDCIGTTKSYTLSDLGYDAITGSINGLMAPISGGLGGCVGTGIAKSLGLEAVEATAKTAMMQTAKTAGKEVVEETIEQTAKQTGKTLLTKVLAKQGMEYVAKEGAETTAKTLFAKGASYGAEMAVDGSLSGATDGLARDLGQGKIEDIPRDMLNGAVNGLIAAPVIGSGFRFANKGGKILNDKIFNVQKLENNIDNTALDSVVKDIKDAKVPVTKNVTKEEALEGFDDYQLTSRVINKKLREGKAELLHNEAEDALQTNKPINDGEYTNLDTKQRLKAINEESALETNSKSLTNEQIQEIISKRTSLYEKLSKNDISYLQNLGEKEWQHAQELLQIDGRKLQFGMKDIENLSKLTDKQWDKAKDLLYINGRKLQLSANDIIKFASLNDEQWIKARDLLLNSTDIKISDILNSFKTGDDANKNLNDFDLSNSKNNINNVSVLRAKYKNTVIMLEQAVNKDGGRILTPEQIDNYLKLLDQNISLRNFEAYVFRTPSDAQKYMEIIPSLNSNNISVAMEFVKGRNVNSLSAIKYFNEKLSTMNEPEAHMFKKNFVELSRLKNPNNTLVFMPPQASRRNNFVPVKKLLDLSISNPDEFAKYQQYMKLIPSGEIPSYIFTDVAENGKISKLVTDDMDKLVKAKATGSDLIETFIPTFKTKSDALRNVQNGDTYSLEGSDKVFISTKNKYGRQQQSELKMDRDTYMKLFPPVKRFALSQGQYGDCYLVSGISNLVSNPNSRAQFYDAFEQKGNDLLVKIPNGGTKIWKNFANISLDQNSKFLKGALGNQLYEQSYQAVYTSSVIRYFAKDTNLLNEPDGFIKLVEEIAKNPNFTKKLNGKTINNITDLNNALNDGGHQIAVLDKILPSKLLDSPKIRNFDDMSSSFNSTEMPLDANHNDLGNIFAYDLLESTSDDTFVKIASSRPMQAGREIALDPTNSIYSGHAYSISNIDSENELVTIVNPWNTAEEITVNYENFFQNFRKYGAKRIEEQG